MNNPYQTSWMRAIKRRSALLHTMMRAVLLPIYLLWRLAKRMPRLHIKLEEYIYTLMTPLRAVGGFVKAWAVGRNWKKLWIASPILVMALVALTVFYINANRNRGRAFAGYYQGAMQAMQEGDFKKSDELFSKLIYHPSYREDDQVLYRAMVSAAQNGNTPRVKALQVKLVEERKFEPAIRWVIEQFVAEFSTDQALGLEYSEMAQNMLEASTDAASASEWRMILARIRAGLENFPGAIAILREDENLTPDGYLLLAQIHLLANDQPQSRQVLRAMLEFIEREDPNESKFFKQKVEAWALLAANTKDTEEAIFLLSQAIEVVERKRALATGDRQSYSTWLSELNIRLFQFALNNRDAESRREGFGFFDAALKHGTVPARTGTSILAVVNASSDYSLLTGQILDVAVHDGGCGAHLALGMEAWLQNDLQTAQLHFSVAYAVQPRAVGVLRAVARDLAKRSVEAQLDMAVFKGVNRSNYQRAQDLLKLVSELGSAQQVEVQFDQCYVYSLRENWTAIIDLMEPSLAELSGSDLLAAYNWLYGANMSLKNFERAEMFKRLMLTEARKQRNSK